MLVSSVTTSRQVGGKCNYLDPKNNFLGLPLRTPAKAGRFAICKYNTLFHLGKCKQNLLLKV